MELKEKKVTKKTRRGGTNISLHLSNKELAILERVSNCYNIPRSKLMRWLIGLLDERHPNPISKNPGYRFEEEVQYLNRVWRIQEDDPWKLGVQISSQPSTDSDIM
jgi:hypothetical protein